VFSSFCREFPHKGLLFGFRARSLILLLSLSLFRCLGEELLELNFERCLFFLLGDLDLDCDLEKEGFYDEFLALILSYI